MKYPDIAVWRMSASRPWQLEQTSQALFDRLKYSGNLHFHLIESVLVESLSKQCVEYAKSIGYKTHVIDPAQGQGFAVNYALHNVINSDYSLKWEDDFQPVVDIDLDLCIEAMEEYKHINQICFNKRKTLGYKWVSDENGKFQFEKEQRFFKVGNRQIPLVVKERWWFGPSIWRTSFIKPLYRYWDSNTHNALNDQVIMPLAGFVYGDELNNFKGRKQPTARQIENNIGCYIFGKTKAPLMAEHTGLNDSIWKGDMQRKWKDQGFKVVGK